MGAGAGRAVPVPTWRLAAAVAAGAAVVLVSPEPVLALVLVDLALLAAALWDWLRAPRPRDLVVTREVAATVVLDTAAEVRWRVVNPRRRRARLRLADDLAPSLRPASRRARLDVPPGGSATTATTIVPSRRGHFRLARVTLRVEGPLRLVARQAAIDVPGQVRVHPPFRSRRDAELRVERSRLLQVGLRSAQGRGGGTEFDSLRDYSVDDDSRRIDWAATARARRPIVRTYRAERNQTVVVLLDCGRTMAGRVALPADPGGHPDGGRPGDVPRLDHGMDAAMMLTAVGTRLGDRVGLVAFADRVRAIVPPGGTSAQLVRVTEAMAPLEPLLVESDYRGAFVETLARFRRRALLVVVTELAEQPVAQTLLPALPLVVRDHLVVVAGLRDPEVARWARAVPTDAAGAFRKAAAVPALGGRRRTVARLRAGGAVVVDAPPGRASPRRSPTPTCGSRPPAASRAVSRGSGCTKAAGV